MLYKTLLTLALLLVPFRLDCQTYTKPDVPHKISRVEMQEIKCLAKNIFHEARGEPVEGMIAVGIVTMNRVADKKFRNTVCDVVYQNKQFSWVHLKKDHKPSEKEEHIYAYIKEIASYVYYNHRNIKSKARDALFYHAHYVSPSWAPKLVKVAKIGSHIFYNRT